MPFVVELTGPEAPAAGEVIELRLVIERQLLSPVPMRIAIELPPGVKLVLGELESVIVDSENRRLERTIRVAIGEALPAEDLIVTVNQREEGWGAHAAKPYRFGRGEPELAPLERDERPVILNGKNHGRPILLH